MYIDYHYNNKNTVTVSVIESILKCSSIIILKNVKFINKNKKIITQLEDYPVRLFFKLTLGVSTMI